LTCAGGDKEHRWLPALAPALPLPIPVPLAKGEPDTGYPYSWSICQWLSGEPAGAHRIADPVRFAVDLAREIWKAALDARWDGAESWFHGDVAEGNRCSPTGIWRRSSTSAPAASAIRPVTWQSHGHC
jgi:aminoglycoside phosphotransferase (APT) family kinase protein